MSVFTNTYYIYPYFYFLKLYIFQILVDGNPVTISDRVQQGQKVKRCRKGLVSWMHHLKPRDPYGSIQETDEERKRVFNFDAAAPGSFEPRHPLWPIVPYSSALWIRPNCTFTTWKSFLNYVLFVCFTTMVPIFSISLLKREKKANRRMDTDSSFSKTDDRVSY